MHRKLIDILNRFGIHHAAPNFSFWCYLVQPISPWLPAIAIAIQRMAMTKSLSRFGTQPALLNHMLSKEINAEKEIISWYGTQEQRSPDARTFSDIVGFEQGIGGQREVVFHAGITYYWHKEDLAVNSFCNDIKIGSTLSFTGREGWQLLYCILDVEHNKDGRPWMAGILPNYMTSLHANEKQIYTSCMDIENKASIISHPETTTWSIPPFADSKLS